MYVCYCTSVLMFEGIDEGTFLGSHYIDKSFNCLTSCHFREYGTLVRISSFLF